MMTCQLCKREGDDECFEKHHLTPKSRKGRETIIVCRSCGDQLHKLFSNKELEKKFNTLDKLLANDRVQTWINWISKKNTNDNVCMRRKK